MYARMTTYGKETDLPVDRVRMGGTSTDVSRLVVTYEHSLREQRPLASPIQAAQLDGTTVAAGGGSMLFFKVAVLFEVGPLRALEAHPGPACYKKNGPLASH